MFEASYEAVDTTGFLYSFSAPRGTSGAVSVPVPGVCTKAGKAVLSKDGGKVKSMNVPVGMVSVGWEGLAGGSWELYFTC